MATIVSQGKTSVYKIEKENFRDNMDVESHIRDIYLKVAQKLKKDGHPLPMWVLDVLNSEK